MGDSAMQVLRKDLAKDLEKAAPRIQQLMPAHLKVGKLIRSALIACQKNPVLLQCDKKSLIRALLEAAQLGVDPSGVLGSAYLVPYKKKVQLIVGYRGLIDLARRSGGILCIEARVVPGCVFL